MAEENERLRPIGHVDEFPPGSCRMVTVGKHEVGIYNVDGEFYAVRNFCPHMGAPVCKGSVGGVMMPSAVGEYTWGMEGYVLHCPWHQWTFDIRTGRALFGIDRSRLVSHTVTREGDELFLDERIRKASAVDDAAATAASTTANGAAKSLAPTGDPVPRTT
jgi:3-phenylpropionate/trans-cinnamate dioxygenase ferredoxin subunit